MRKYSEVMIALRMYPARGERLVRRALRKHQGKLEETAAALGIHQTTLSRILRENAGLRNYRKGIK